MRCPRSFLGSPHELIVPVCDELVRTHKPLRLSVRFGCMYIWFEVSRSISKRNGLWFMVYVVILKTRDGVEAQDSRACVMFMLLEEGTCARD